MSGCGVLVCADGSTLLLSLFSLLGATLRRGGARPHRVSLHHGGGARTFQRGNLRSERVQLAFVFSPGVGDGVGGVFAFDSKAGEGRAPFLRPRVVLSSFSFLFPRVPFLFRFHSCMHIRSTLRLERGVYLSNSCFQAGGEREPKINLNPQPSTLNPQQRRY